ncbi:hypothetical protein E2C01_093634 [Portunus trituberculatus]|uniref:Uncharacterized protein n=1 Tax=Portunus trituberculatus TaxID=210409 RepID=A0A5B7JQB7_PORTR|nr:hypothetical protein [Portunus trituberculatus]
MMKHQRYENSHSGLPLSVCLTCLGVSRLACSPVWVRPLFTGVICLSGYRWEKSS